MSKYIHNAKLPRNKDLWIKAKESEKTTPTNDALQNKCSNRHDALDFDREDTKGIINTTSTITEVSTSSAKPAGTNIVKNNKKRNVKDESAESISIIVINKIINEFLIDD